MNRINLAIKRFFSEGHERFFIAKKNITLTFFIRGSSILISIVVVPLTIDYVNPTQYGLWLTMSSVIVWFNFFDIELGSGLKNKLTAAIAHKKHQLAKAYVTTAYGLLGIISLVIILLYASLKSSIDWAAILNVPPGLNNELNTLAFYMVLTFGIAFVLQLANIIFYALHQSAKVAMVSLMGNIFSLVLVLILKATTNGSLLYLGLSLFFCNLLSLLMYSAWFFLRETRTQAFTMFYQFKTFEDAVKPGFKIFHNPVICVGSIRINKYYHQQIFFPIGSNAIQYPPQILAIIAMILYILLTYLLAVILKWVLSGFLFL